MAPGRVVVVGAAVNDLSLQVYGLPGPGQGFEVVQGLLSSRPLRRGLRERGVVTAALGCNMPRPLRTWRQVVASATPWREALTAVA